MNSKEIMTYANKYAVLGFIALILLDVFMFSTNMMFGMNVLKTIYFHFVIGLIGMWSIFNLTTMKSVTKIRLNICDITFTLIILWYLLRSDSVEIVLLLLPLFLLYFVIKFNAITIYDNSKWLFVVSFVSVTTLLLSLIGLFQLYNILPSYNSLFKITGTTINPSVFSQYLALMLIILFIHYKYNKLTETIYIKRVRNLLLITMLLALVMIVTTLIRTAWVGVATGIIAAFLFMNGKSVITRFQKKRTYILITVISLFVLFLLSFLLYSIKKESIQGRLFIWKVSSEHFFEKPFLGIGSNRFLVEYNNWQAEYFLNTPYDISNAYLADNVQSVYNEFLQAFIETGLVGVILFVAFCVALLWRAKILLKTCKDDKSNKKEIILISASCVSGILAMSMFSYTLHFLPLLILFVLFAGLISGTIQDSNSKESVAWCVGMKIRKIGIYSIIGIISLFFCVSMWVNIAQIKCYTEWNKAVAEYNEGNYLSSLAIYESIFPYMKNDGYFLLYYGTTLYMSHDYENAKRNLQKSKEIYIGPDSEYQIRGMLSEDKGLCNSRMSLQICKRNAPQPYVSKIPVSSLV